MISPAKILTSFNSSENLTCNAEGGPDNMFRWSQNGRVIPGANDPVLSIPMVTGTDGGSYRCKVINGIGDGNNFATVTGR